MPSSSPLPSPGEIFKHNAPVLHTGSRAGAIPSSALSSFTTASALLKDPQLDAPARIRSFSAVAEGGSTKSTEGGPDEVVWGDEGTGKSKAKVAVKQKITKEKAVRKRASKTGDIGEEIASAAPKKALKTAAKKGANSEERDGGVQGVKPRKMKAKDDGVDVHGSNAASKPKQTRKAKTTSLKTKEQPTTAEHETESSNKKASSAEVKPRTVRKPRAKKPIDTSQGLIPSHDITKPSTAAAHAIVAHASNSSTFKDDVDVGLIQAVKRRVDWTPPVPVANPTITSPASRLVLEPILHASDTIAPKDTSSFKDLFSTFGFVDKNDSKTTSQKANKSAEQALLRKRKLVELVRTSSIEDATSPTKKPPKKKATTITGRATEAYTAIEDDTTPLMQYFSAQPKESASKSTMLPPLKRRGKSPVKGSREAPILLSPESAMKQVANQDFVFGTSSQLAREDSPTLLRDLHEAIQASLGDVDSGLPDESVTKPGRLWSAAARTTDGSLVNSPEKVALQLEQARAACNSEFVDVDHLADLAGYNRQDTLMPTFGSVTQLSSRSVLEDDLPPPSAQSDHATEPIVAHVEAAPTAGSLPVVSSDGNLMAPSPAKQTKKVAKKSPAEVKAKDTGGLEMPKFETYTTARLAKEIATYHFKPMKNRDAMVKLLETCWRAKHQAALQSKDPNSAAASPTKASKVTATATSDASTTTPIKKPRGRPKKDSTLSSSSPAFERKPKGPTKATKKASTPQKIRDKQDSQEEINDSDVQLMPSPPRRHASQVGKPPLPLELSIDHETSPELTSSQQQAELFTHITMAVKSAPRATDNKNPSWHEKVLLYDPIILEDLTIWLNGGNLSRVGYDGEVAPAEVKKWCESKSICCLWKENLRGGNRSRY